MPLATGRLNRRSSKEAIAGAISKAIATMMEEYKKSGKIGNTKPDDEGHALKIAQAIAYADARRNAGSKVKKEGG